MVDGISILILESTRRLLLILNVIFKFIWEETMAELSGTITTLAKLFGLGVIVSEPEAIENPFLEICRFNSLGEVSMRHCTTSVKISILIPTEIYEWFKVVIVNRYCRLELPIDTFRFAKNVDS
jgi:hypothetical protein